MDTRKVYVIERKEVISHSYYVIADSRNEALDTFEEKMWDGEWGYCSDMDYKYSGLENDLETKVFLMDGSHQHHRYMKPKVERSFKEKLSETFGVTSMVKRWRRVH